MGSDLYHLMTEPVQIMYVLIQPKSHLCFCRSEELQSGQTSEKLKLVIPACCRVYVLLKMGTYIFYGRTKEKEKVLISFFLTLPFFFFLRMNWILILLFTSMPFIYIHGSEFSVIRGKRKMNTVPCQDFTKFGPHF